MTAPRRALVVSSSARSRLDRARAWLEHRQGFEPVLLVGHSTLAVAELTRQSAHACRQGAFGAYRYSLQRLALALAVEPLARQSLAPASPVALEAVWHRVVHALETRDRLGRFSAVADRPGLPRAIGRALAEVRLARVPPDRLDPDTREALATVEQELERAGLADPAKVFELAASTAREGKHRLARLPTLFLDVAVSSTSEAELVNALGRICPDLLVTVPAGDVRTQTHLERGLAVAFERLAPTTHLAIVQERLFAATAEALPGAPSGAVVVLSAPGEGRECTELARHIIAHARSGTRFDRMAVLLRAPQLYRPLVAEALRRAGVPAHFVSDARAPDPAGRALLALLCCAHENLSARRFAEYLSLAEVPDPTPRGEPPEPLSPEARFALAQSEERPDEGLEPQSEASAPPFPVDADAPVRSGTVRSLRRWERLLCEASVLGGHERWHRRFAGLEAALRLERASPDCDEPSAARLERDLADLSALRDYGLPLIDELARLPTQATMGEWLEHLGALATRALRHPQRVLRQLSELTPMSPVGPLGLGQLRGILAPRLTQLSRPSTTTRAGSVLVGPIDAVRGLDFDVVFLPGLAEKLFPRKVVEEPILLDAHRESLSTELETNDDRVQAERLLLRLAVGAATSHLVISYPRLDAEQARPRVPSFYGLELLRAATGVLPGHDDFSRQAEDAAGARLSWPAPGRPEQAIDAGEFDLAVLASIVRLDPAERAGRARYLVESNPHLMRSLRARYMRWDTRWMSADGLVRPGPAGLAALAPHALKARSYSATALQTFAACPYRFLLHAVHRLTPRDVPEPIEELDPLQRGSIVHQIQFELLQRLREEGLLPVTTRNVADAMARLDEIVEAVAARWRDDLAPAVHRVWEDGIASIRADLREWLRRMVDGGTHFVPWRFELAFGLRQRGERDPASTLEPVVLDEGIILRGSIDLVERSVDGTLRATDHKTGKVRATPGTRVGGGETLQPLLYALALEKLVPDAKVESGRLYYCTQAGEFQSVTIALDPAARGTIRNVAFTLQEALDQGFLPAAPKPGACDFCDYVPLCGPHEEARTRRKRADALASLQALRELE